MISSSQLIIVLVALGAAAILSYAFTPVAKHFSIRFGFIDVPKDARRVHKKPIPTVGGLAIYMAFLIVVVCLTQLNRQLMGIMAGALIIVVMGLIDDKYDLNAKLKLVIQICAVLLPISQGCVIRYISHPFAFLGSTYLPLGILAYPFTLIWIVAIVNAVNFIDGLDGLSVGVCSISSLCMLVIAVMIGQGNEAVIIAAVLGACLGFLPYNFNPASIFMGDTGATFLGYILACMSVTGLFKLYTAISFAVPVLALGVPLIDITFAFVRRLWHHVSPMHADRSHIHHRLIDSGFNQRQSVLILYAIASLLGVVAVVLSLISGSKTGSASFGFSGFGKLVMVFVAMLAIAVLSVIIWQHNTKKHGAGNQSTKK